jgi:hypothetical protein
MAGKLEMLGAEEEEYRAEQSRVGGRMWALTALMSDESNGAGVWQIVSNAAFYTL